MRMRLMAVWAALVVAVVVGCGTKPSGTNAPVAGPTPDGRPAPPAPGELGSATKPINMYFVRSGEAEGGLEATVGAVAKFVEQKTGYTIKPLVLADPTVVEAFGTGEAHVAWMGPAGYARAYQKGGRIRLSTLRHGEQFYYAMIVTGAETGITKLADCAGKSFAHRGVTSTSGYVFPMMLFKKAGVTIGEATAVGTAHDNVITSVDDGTCQIGAAYWSPPVVHKPEGIKIEGFTVDKNTGLVTLTNGMKITQTGELLDTDGNPVPGAEVELADARAKVKKDRPRIFQTVRIIALTDRIPNDGVIFHAKLSDEITNTIIDALLEFADTEQGKKVLDDMYNITGLAEIRDADLADFRDLVLTGEPQEGTGDQNPANN